MQHRGKEPHANPLVRRQPVATVAFDRRAKACPERSRRGEAERNEHKADCRRSWLQHLATRYSQLGTRIPTRRRTPHVTSGISQPASTIAIGKFSRRNACAFRRFASSLEFPVSFSPPPHGAWLSLFIQLHRRSANREAVRAATGATASRQRDHPRPVQACSFRWPLPAPKSTPPSVEKPSPPSPAVISAAPRI